MDQRIRNATAEDKELDLAIKRNEYRKVSEIEKGMADMAREVLKMLDDIPRRWATGLTMLATADVEKKLADEIRKVREKFADKTWNLEPTL